MLRRVGKVLAVWMWAVFGVTVAPGQTLSPPIAEYRGKANGVLELRNDGDVPLAAILEPRGFSVDSSGNVTYHELDPRISLELGSQSFNIPPHQVHYVFYKGSSTRLPAWFAVMNTLTPTTAVFGGLRVNIILPHLVYLYQKPRLKKRDIRTRILIADSPGEYRLEIENLSEKLGRVESVESKGFAANQTYGGFPLFPGQIRPVSLKVGASLSQARFRIRFEDGFRLDESPPPTY